MPELIILGHRGQGGTNWGIPKDELLKPRPHLDNEILPENSISAFSYALAHGADGFECDVYLSSDEVPIVIHDNELARNVDGFHYWGKDNREDCLGKVSDFTAAALKQFSIGNKEGVPTLEEVIQLAIKHNPEHLARTGKNLTINIEIKGGPKAAKKIYELMQRYLYPNSPFQKSDFLFNSFDRESVLSLLHIDPTLRVAQGVRTKDLFKEVQMPGWIPKEDHYSVDSEVFLNEIINLNLIPGLDLVTSDIKESLIKFCVLHHLFLNAATCSLRLKLEAIKNDWQDKNWSELDREKKELRKLRNWAHKYDLDIYYKADNPGEIYTYLKELDRLQTIAKNVLTKSENFLKQTTHDPQLLRQLQNRVQSYLIEENNHDSHREFANAYLSALDAKLHSNESNEMVYPQANYDPRLFCRTENIGTFPKSEENASHDNAKKPNIGTK